MSPLSLRTQFAWLLFAAVVVACLALFVSVQTAYYGLLFAAVAWWTWVYPEEAFLFFIMLAPLFPMFKITQTMGDFTLVKDVMILTIFVKEFLIPLFSQRLPYRRNVFFLPLVALLVWVSLATLRADSHTLGILRARDIVLYIMLYVGVLYLPISKEILKTRLHWFLWGLAGVLVLAVYQWFWAADGAVLRFDPVRQIWIPRISSTLGHPTVFGEYLILAISFFTAAFLVLKEKYWRTYAAVGILILLPFIYLTYSRGVWLGLLVAWTAVAFTILISKLHIGRLSFKTWRNIGWGVAGAVIILLGIVRFTPVGNFVRSAIDPTYPSNQIRLQFLNRLIASTSNTEALIGKGLGDVVNQTSTTTDVTGTDIVSGDSRSIQLSKDSTLVDDQYLKTFIEMGLLGLLIYAWIYKRFFSYSYQLSLEDSQLVKIIGYTGIGFLAAFVVQALFVDIWDVFPTNALFWIVAAIISTAAFVDIDKKHSRENI